MYLNQKGTSFSHEKSMKCHHGGLDTINCFVSVRNMTLCKSPDSYLQNLTKLGAMRSLLRSLICLQYVRLPPFSQIAQLHPHVSLPYKQTHGMKYSRLCSNSDGYATSWFKERDRKNESKRIQSNVFPRLPGKLALVVFPFERITSRDTRLFWALRDVRWKKKSTCTARAYLVSRRTLICSFCVHILWNWCNSKDLVDICKSPHKHTGYHLMLYQPWSMSSFFLHLSLSLLHLFSFY